MIRNIIIVGTGKAANLHYQKYKKIGGLQIFFLDVKKSSRYIDSDKIYLSIEKLINDNNLVFNDTITDICTPCSEFKNVIDDLILLGEHNFIIEKPFIVEDDYFSDKKDINFLMVENYKYSEITKYIDDYLKNNNLTIKNLYINFSKDRINDSMKLRGISDKNKIPTCFEIEMPHEIYLANYFVNIKQKSYNRILLGDMNCTNLSLSRHGYGYINYSDNSNSKNIILESDLMNKSNDRFIRIECDDGTKIFGSYLTYDSDFVRETSGIVNIIKDGQHIKKIFEIDDNMFLCLKNYLYILNNKINNDAFKNDILNFSREIKYCISNALNVSLNNKNDRKKTL